MRLNLGLLQANISWLGKKRGQSYHCILDLFSHLKLPVFDGMVDALENTNKIKGKNLAKTQNDEAKEQSRKLEHRNNRRGSCEAAGSILNMPTAVMNIQLKKKAFLALQVYKSLQGNVNVVLWSIKASGTQ